MLQRFALPRPLFLILLGVLAVLPGSQAAARGNDFQAWQWLTVDLYDTDRWRFYLYADNRIGETVSGSTDSYLQILSPRLKWHAREHLDLGLGYAWLNIDPLSGADAYWQHRAEFECNPRFRAGPWSFHNRNRLELRWDNGHGECLPRLRTRLQAEYRLGDGFFKHLFTNNEFFFDLTNGEYSENRLIPVGLGLKLTDGATLNLFYMVQSQDRSGGWKHDHIAGTFLQLSF